MVTIYKSDSEQSEVKLCHDFEENSWIRMINPTSKEIEEVSSKVNIPASLISQVLVEKELPRIKQVSKATLIVIDVPYMKDKSMKNKYITYPLGIILCDSSYVITVSLKEFEFMQDFVDGKVEDFYTSKMNRFFVQISLKSSEVYFNTLGLIDEDINRMEKNTYYSTNNRVLINFLNMQKTLVYFLTSLQANSHVLERLQSEDVISMEDYEKVLLGDAIIENKQCIETSVIYRDILDSTMEAYGSIISNNLNIIMKFLAGVTIVFSIPTMISSFLGMNVDLGIIGESEYSFVIVCLVSCLLSVFIAIWLKKRNML